MRIVILAALLTSLTAAGCITTPNFYVDKTGDGEGRITSDTGDVDCGDDCGGLIEGPITLTATPVTDSVFAGWSGTDACSTEPICNLTITEDTRIAARFDRVMMALEVTPVEHGVIHARGIDCGDDCSESYAYETYVTLTVTTDTGWEVVGWEGANCTGSSCALRMTESYSVTPILAPSLSTLYVNIVGGPYPVLSFPEGISCGSQCVAQYAAGTVVSLTAGSSNVLWSGCTVNPMLSWQCELTVHGTANVTVTFY